MFALLSEPFFEASTHRIRRHPANLILRCATPIAALAKFAERDQPDVLIFHISRCGSTLVARMLGALDSTRVLSEPPLLDEAIQLYLRGLIDAETVRGLAGALGREAGAGARRRVVKFDSWHCLALDRIADLFVQAQAMLLFRDPVEVLVSHHQSPGMQVLKGAVPFDTFGLTGARGIDSGDFAGWAIAGIMRGAMAAADRQGILLCDYADLPAAFGAQILPHCQIAPAAHEMEAVSLVAQQHSKRPDAPFESDSLAKQDAADPELRAQAARQGLPQLYSEMRLRAGQ